MSGCSATYARQSRGLAILVTVIICVITVALLLAVFTFLPNYSVIAYELVCAIVIVLHLAGSAR